MAYFRGVQQLLLLVVLMLLLLLQLLLLLDPIEQVLLLLRVDALEHFRELPVGVGGDAIAVLPNPFGLPRPMIWSSLLSSRPWTCLPTTP